MIIQQPFTIAIQRRGKLRDDSEATLQLANITLEEDVLRSECENTGVRILYVRDDDIPEYVRQGVADFGIVGENVIAECGIALRIVQKLSFGNCRLVIAVPETSTIQSIQDLAGERIATSYPNLLRMFLQEQGIQASIIEITGSVEVAPELNLADAICDLTQSGATLKEHNLRELVTLYSSEAVLVSNPTLPVEQFITL